MDHGVKAADNFAKGYNCAQSVVLAYADEIGLERKTALMLSSSFGGGMGRLREVCGAVSGIFMVAGIKFGYSDPQDNAAKKNLYRLVQEFAHRFEEENGSIICRELLCMSVKKDSPEPEKRTGEYYKKRPCKELVASAADIFDYLCKEVKDGGFKY